MLTNQRQATSQANSANQMLKYMHQVSVHHLLTITRETALAPSNSLLWTKRMSSPNTPWSPLMQTLKTSCLMAPQTRPTIISIRFLPQQSQCTSGSQVLYMLLDTASLNEVSVEISWTFSSSNQTLVMNSSRWSMQVLLARIICSTCRIR